MYDPILLKAATAALQRSGQTVSCAESCTGGLLAAALTELPGSSAWFNVGFVTYSNAAKQQLLGVQAQTLVQHGAVSAETVCEMAQGAQAAASAQGCHDFAAQWAGQGAPLARELPAAELLARLVAEMRQA